MFLSAAHISTELLVVATKSSLAVSDCCEKGAATMAAKGILCFLWTKWKWSNTPSRIRMMEQERWLRCHDCSRTQIQTILKIQELITCGYETSAPAARKCLCGPQYDDIHSTEYHWYSTATQRLGPDTGTVLQEEALVFASSLGINKLKAYNCWFQRVKKQNNIKQLVVSSESEEVDQVTVTAWQERLVTLIQGYASEVIWNEYETDCFFWPLPDKTFTDAKKLVKNEEGLKFSSLWHSVQMPLEKKYQLWWEHLPCSVLQGHEG